MEELQPPQGVYTVKDYKYDRSLYLNLASNYLQARYYYRYQGFFWCHFLTYRPGVIYIEPGPQNEPLALLTVR